MSSTRRQRLAQNGWGKYEHERQLRNPYSVLRKRDDSARTSRLTVGTRTGGSLYSYPRPIPWGLGYTGVFPLSLYSHSRMGKRCAADVGTQLVCRAIWHLGKLGRGFGLAWGGLWVGWWPPLSGPPDGGVISVQPVNTVHIQHESTYNPPNLAVPLFRSISFVIFG